MNFIKRGEAAAHVGGMGNYFAIGYPGYDQYDLDLPPLQHIFSPELTNDLDLFPLFITKALAAVAPVTMNNGKIAHGAPTAAGMSGGSLLTVDGENVNIFGVITSGSDDDEEACNLE